MPKMRDNSNGHLGSSDREPRITQKGYIVLSRLSRLLNVSTERYAYANCTVLDVGCGNKPYQPFFKGKSAAYLGVDINQNSSADVLCNGEELPFRESTFSICLCLQVLEHANEPKMVIDEVFRVLKSGRMFFLSSHGNWVVHGAPYDYWRWTEHGLVKLLHGFDICEIHNCGGSSASIIQLLNLLIPGRKGLPLIVFFNILADLLDNSWVNAKLLGDLATNYLVIAKKV